MALFDLRGRVAVVTGGNGGIGLGMAKGLAGAGAAVVVAARNAGKAEAAVAELKAISGKAGFIALDVAADASCESMVKSTVKQFGRLDILVNNAGMNIRKPPQDLALEEWRKVMETNITGAFACSRAAYPAMKASGGGKIINIGSMTSIFGVPFAVAYSSSKGAIVQMTKSLATAWAKDNIQVNCILPGWIDTDLTRAARKEVQGLHERVLARTPAGRWGNPDDFAGIAVFLSSKGSDFLTGTAIAVDGGYSSLG